MTFNNNSEGTENITLARNIINSEIKYLHYSGKSKIFEKQISTASEIINNFKDTNIINQLVVGKTQSGKTGLMLASVQAYINNNIIPHENIYLITGLSSRDWKAQTKDRLPKYINSNVYHRSDINKEFINDIKNKQHVLIILDEVHIGCIFNQTIGKVFKKISCLIKLICLPTI